MEESSDTACIILNEIFYKLYNYDEMITYIDNYLKENFEDNYETIKI